MRRLLTFVAFFATLQASAQQVNPVPDYVFANRMSAGRNTVTDTAAYFSIGPRYGATRGMMPPMVVDTASFSANKRNGLLIFSVQKNKFLYWDSVRVQWSDMAGGSGSYILAGDTSAMLAPYLRKADTTAMLLPYIRHAGFGLTKSGQSLLVDTLNIATRAWRQKGIDSVVSIIPAAGVGGSGTTNYVPKFTAGTTIGNSIIFDNATNVGIGTASPSARLHIVGAELRVQNDNALYSFRNAAGTRTGYFQARADAFDIWNDQAVPMVFGTNNTERLRIFANGRVFVGASPTDAGYQLDVAGSLRNTTGANFATSSGSVGIGTASPIRTLHVYRSGVATELYLESDAATQAAYYLKNTSNALYMPAGRTGQMRFFVNAADRVTFDSTGFVGIGTTAPTYNLDINGTLRSVNGANFATTSGNVGIGTASPLSKLHAFGAGGSTAVKLTLSNGGDVNALNDPMGVIDFYSDDASGGLQGTKGYLGVYNEFNGNWDGSGSRYDTYMAFGTSLDNSLSEKMRIKSDAELLINTTSDAGDYKLQVAGNIYNTGSAVLAATSGIVGIGTTSPTALASTSGLLHVNGASTNSELHLTNTSTGATATDGGLLLQFGTRTLLYNLENSSLEFGTNNIERGRINSAGEWIIDASGTDAGDYKLQVVGNARIGTGKLDIASNTTFGLGVARSGTSEVAGQIYNSNGILYLGAESSAGGQIFSGSSAYAAVIGSGANYPLQFAANNITRATLTTNGNFMIGFQTDTYFYRLQVNGSIFSNNQIIAQNAAAQLNIDSSTNISPLYISNQSLTGSSAQGLFYGSTTWNTTGNPSLIDLAITNTASGSDANYIKISDGSNIFRVTKAAEVVTAAPTGGSIRKWKLGEAATVSPTSPNRTIRVEIDGTVYYLHAKTTND